MQTPPARTAREQFDKQAAHYDTQWSSWSEETLRWMLDAARTTPQTRALDVATGTGFTALAFAPQVSTVVGLDVSPKMLAEARRRASEAGVPNAAFVEGSAEALPFPDGAFELVTCRIAPHHFLSVPDFLAEARRVLTDGGALVLVDTAVPDNAPEAAAWQNAAEVLRDPSHVQNYTPSEWRVMTEAAGLAVQELTLAGGGITIPLSDWLTKAGCTPAQSAQVRQAFADASQSAREAFQIMATPDGETVFTWPRVALRAVKVVQ